jgi:glycosyltransferase involved in cell wall biosynthesis
MGRGFGVPVVVSEIGRRLANVGLPVLVGAMETGEDTPGLHVEQVPAEARAVAALAHREGCDTIVAHTSPFFELLPELAGDFKCWAWEHGDPTPAFFETDRHARQQVIEDKRRRVYPAVQGLLAVSDFLRSELQWGPCRVIHNGVDHVPDLGPKSLSTWLCRDTRRLRVGTLMRLGPGEARYKGNAIFMRIKTISERARLSCDFAVMGRGTQSDAEPFREQGIEVRLNADEHEKWEYLRGLDVFLSCSLWEGFNLPLAEAQALGTVGLAFDIGAHPEVTPLLMGGVPDVVRQLRAYARDSALLRAHSSRAYSFVRGRFSWRQAAHEFLGAIGSQRPRSREDATAQREFPSGRQPDSPSRG